MTNHTQASLVLERFGGYAPMSEKTGVPEQTIRNWVREGTIPQKHHLKILLDAQRARIQLLPHDLVSHLTTELIAAAQAGDSETPAAQADVAAS